MQGRLRAKIAVPPHRLSVNPRYRVGDPPADNIENHNGALFIEEANRMQRGDLWLCMEQLKASAAEIARLIGKPKKTVLRWARSNGSRGDFIPMTREDADRLHAECRRRGIRHVRELWNGKESVIALV